MNAETKTTQTGHSDDITEGIRVRVAAQYLAERSDPDSGLFVYAYRVVISNEGDQAATLRSRHWIIRDADNERKDVRGDGVVGKQPRLAPGETFEYVSGCPLSTEWGTMEGSFRMHRDDDSEFDARVGRFFLARTVAPLSDL